MKYFSVPADFNKKTIDGYYKLNNTYSYNCVKETYGQITINNNISSGRLVMPQVDFEKLKDYTEYSQEKGIDFNYTLNGMSMNNMEFTKDGIEQINSLLHQIYNIGIRNITVALPPLIELIKNTNLNFNIKVSTISQINNVNKAIYYKKLGVNRIVVDESINRDFEKLKDIRDSFGENVEVIVNSICNKDCIYRMYHYNQIANDCGKISNNVSIKYYSNRCILWRYENISNILKLCWIRPEDIKYYYDIGIKYFKIQGRHLVSFGNPVKAVECYFNEDFDGNLFELFDLFISNGSYNLYLDNKKIGDFIKPFVRGKFCDDNCEKCNYCISVAQKINLGKQYVFKNIVNNYICNSDGFKNMIKICSKD